MYQANTFPPSHYTLYYMYINSKSGCNICPKYENFNSEKAKKEKQRERNS